MLTTVQIERQLHCCNQVPRNETPVQRIERLKKEVEHAVLHDYPGGVTILHLVDEFNLSESVVRENLRKQKFGRWAEADDVIHPKTSPFTTPLPEDQEWA